MITKTIDDKEKVLKDRLTELGGAVVAFSGGVDSTYLLSVAASILPPGNLLAVTAASETYPQREQDAACELARSIGAAHRVIESRELAIPGFAENSLDRCFYCKQELFGLLLEIAEKENIPAVLDGANHDDLSDYRPGSKAARKLGVISPLQDAGLTKDEIRLLSKRRGLSTWDKPSMACLSSRFPFGDAITDEKLKMVGAGEEFLFSLGLKQVRLRHHGSVARLEIDPAEFSFLLQKRETITRHLHSLGYKHIALDLDGYRTGSMNQGKTLDPRG